MVRVPFKDSIPGLNSYLGGITGWWREFWRVARCRCGLCSHGLCGGETPCAVLGLAESRCLPGAGGSCVWAGAQQVWGSWRLDQDVPAVLRRPSSRPRVRPRVAAFHLSNPVWLGAQHFLLVTKLSYRQTSVLQGEEAGGGVGGILWKPRAPGGTWSA